MKDRTKMRLGGRKKGQKNTRGSALIYASLPMRCCAQDCLRKRLSATEQNRLRCEYVRLARRVDRKKWVYEHFWETTEPGKGTFKYCHRCLNSLFRLGGSTLSNWRNHYMQLSPHAWRAPTTKHTANNMSEEIRQDVSGYAKAHLLTSSDQLYVFPPMDQTQKQFARVIREHLRLAGHTRLPSVPSIVRIVAESRPDSVLVGTPSERHACVVCALFQMGIRYLVKQTEEMAHAMQTMEAKGQGQHRLEGAQGSRNGSPQTQTLSQYSQITYPTMTDISQTRLHQGMGAMGSLASQ
ncbi:hypothetical protein KIPB_010581, partial [Kipferlia bialata]|eukprot:g10581.t1